MRSSRYRALSLTGHFRHVVRGRDALVGRMKQMDNRLGKPYGKVQKVAHSLAPRHGVRKEFDDQVMAH